MEGVPTGQLVHFVVSQVSTRIAAMEEPDRIALCVTCVVDQLMPEVGVATVKVLRRAGCQVEFPPEQTCCGQPFFNSGFRKQAAQLAKRTIEIFEAYEFVVLPSGSCTSMIRMEYAHLLEPWPEWQERAKRLAAKSYELSEFLVQKMDWRPAGSAVMDPSGAESSAARVTYHDSCHMCRLLRVRDEPRQLLDAVGFSLHEMEEPDRCCGFGGLFSLRLPEVASAMTVEKLQQAAATKAVLVTADPGCLMQMRGLASQEGPRVEHLAVMLEEQTR